VSAAATLADLVAPLRADPARSAVLLDVDGTLAPIVRHAADATVPEATRLRLIEIAKRYAVTACVTGRRATDARQIVSIGSIAYIGSHGGEVLRPGATQAEVDPELEDWTRRVREFAESADAPELTRLGVRSEDKGAIAAFHWRGAPDEAAAQAALRDLAGRAEAEGPQGARGPSSRPPGQGDGGTGPPPRHGRARSAVRRRRRHRPRRLPGPGRDDAGR
jgi:trehalose 6-phosphate phosphatase